MKMNSDGIKFTLVLIVATILVFLDYRPVFAQETAQKESNKKILIKIVSDDNGRRTVIDTTFENPDSTIMDSINKRIDKIIVMAKGGKHARFKFHGMPQEYDYDFDISSMPEMPKDLNELEDFEWEGTAPGRDMEDRDWEQMAPEHQQRVLRSGGHRQTLTDVLGEIPMDRVVNYSIKSRKNGKRIIIDLNDAPLFEQQDRVIVIHEPGRMQHNSNYPGHRIKVHVNSHNDRHSGNSAEPPDPSSVSPPPAAQPDKK